jgi:hypothetical protein
VPVCDGCGRSVDETHIRRRIERLEMATRFRPIHIGVLLIDAAPPAHHEDFFYALGDGPRSLAGQNYFNELAKLTGATAESAAAAESVCEREAALAEFQRRGFFLTHAVECPMDDPAELRAAIQRSTPTILLRIRTSYKPKQVALISEPTSALIDPFRAADWSDRLLLDAGQSFSAESLSARLSAALASLPSHSGPL